MKTIWNGKPALIFHNSNTHASTHFTQSAQSSHLASPTFTKEPYCVFMYYLGYFQMRMINTYMRLIESVF